MASVARGDLVKIHYIGRLPSGEQFVSSRDDEPAEFAAGADDVLPGISEAVIGMNSGETRTVTLTSDEAYGPRVDQLVQEVPREHLPDTVQVNDQLSATMSEGEGEGGGNEEFPVWVREIRESTVVLDGNHPLAGETLEFEIELLSVEASS